MIEELSNLKLMIQCLLIKIMEDVYIHTYAYKYRVKKKYVKLRHHHLTKHHYEDIMDFKITVINESKAKLI